jgi:predicted nuclease of predicted toxin-antitoxin system
VSKFLLDANLSPKTRAFLQDVLGLDAEDLLTRSLSDLSDEEVIGLAKTEGRVIITFDRGFGERYYHQERGQVGIIVLRLSNQRRFVVEQALARFFQTQAATIKLDTSLVIIEDAGLRVISAE